MIPISDGEFMAARGAQQMANSYARNLAEFQAALKEANRLRAVAERKLKSATQALAVEQAHAAGLKAQLTAMRHENPTSKLMQPTGRVAADGTVELVMHATLYNPAFDAKARELGIENPEAYRD